MLSENAEAPYLHDLRQTLFVLANVKRLSILIHLQNSEMNVGTLAESLKLSQSSLSQHLTKLKSLGIVEVRKHQQMRFYGLKKNNLSSNHCSIVVQQILTAMCKVAEYDRRFDQRPD